MDLSQIMDVVQSIAAAAAPIAVTALWQGAAIALGLALCLRVTPRVSARLRFALWIAAFTVVIALPFLPRLSGHGSVATSGIGSVRPWLQVDLRWSLAIAAVWIVVSAMRAIDLAINSWRLRRLWKSALPAQRADALMAVTFGRRPVQICTTRELDRPSVIGFFAPRILIPEWLYERLTDTELEQIVLHEVEHLRRCDDWTNFAQKLCLVLFPLNPALWWMERQLCKEREMACDEGVIAITRAPRAYAACLASLAERGLARKAEALSLGAWQRRPELVQRVHSILRRGSAMSPFASGALVATLGGGLMAVSVGLARSPQIVAFVPAQSIALAGNHTPVAAGSDAVDAVYRPEAAHVGTTGFQAVEAKAVMPLAVHFAQGAETATVESRPVKTHAPVAHAQQVSAKRLPQTKPAAQQQWIVLTSWEQIDTSSTSAPAGLVSDATQNDAGSDPGSDTNTQAQTQMTSRVTVTQLVFRIVPTGSKSSQPKAVPFRGGWFILQL
jgi:beta-lactamase regulating signal transducer with metallopeptidase domain